MKNKNAKSTIAVCLIGAVVLMSILAGLMMIESGRAENDRGAAVELVKALTSHDPIYINGNADFIVGQNGVVSGSGTEVDPYIIENWDINASSANGIDIRNTDVYFIIRNCYIHDGKSNIKGGIYFYNVTNGKIENVTSYNNSNGIELYSSSNNNTITNSHVYNNSNIHCDGISLNGSNYCNITTNIISNNYYGISLRSYSNNNIIIGNNVSNNEASGINIVSSINNLVTENVVMNNDRGITLNNASYNSITDNKANFNNWYGIWLCPGIQVEDNASNNNINNNIASNNQHGIHLSSSSNNTITNCTVYNNYYGIYLYSSSNNTITNCYAYNNSNCGIELDYSSNNQIHYNNIYDNTNYGVYNYNPEVGYQANATNNWWGSATGPYNPYTNPAGTGDNVSENVLYNPWLTEPWSGEETGLVACWHFNENTGTTAYDSSGNNNNGTIYGATWTSGVSGSALSFDGVNDYVEVTDSTTLNITEAITLEAWVYTKEIALQSIVTRRNAYINYQMYLDEANCLSFYTTAFQVNSPVNIPIDTRTHVVITYDKNQMKFYKNGILTNYSSQTLSLTSTTGKTYFGRSGSGSEDWFNGTIDEVRIYNRALSASEIQTHYEYYEPNLSACWHFDENTGSIAYDSSGNNNNGTIYGASWTTGVNGSALSFDGTDDYVNVSHHNNLNIGGNGEGFTAEAWIKQSGPTTTWQQIIRKGDANAIRYEFKTDSTGTQLRIICYPDGINGVNVDAAIIADDGNWHYVVFTKSSSDNLLRLYFDGSLKGTSTSTCAGTEGSSDNLCIGCGSGVGEFFNGTIDEVRIWNRALNASEIQAHYEEYKPIELTAHAPISINGNSNFTSANGVTSGNGTVGNPYIIENWDINASTADGIHIENTTAYFIIRNCVIHDGKLYSAYGYNYYGIYFYNVINSKIDNVTSYDNYYGIYLCSSSNNNQITNCSVYNNSWEGIYLDYSSNNNITNCSVYNNPNYGIYLYSSSNNNITNCNVYNNSGYWGYNYAGINLDYSSNNTITNCNVYSNYEDGILLDYSSNNIITNCYVYSNSEYGICLYYSSNNNITNCNAYSNYNGIMFSDDSSNNTITNCAIYNSSDSGIYLRSFSNNNYITNCAVYNNSNFGIFLGYSSNNYITNCAVYNNSRYWYSAGIELSVSSNNNITNCYVYNNLYGIYLYSSSNNDVHYCNIYNNTDHGIYNSNTETQYQVNATYNWWGSASGPYNPVTNPSGTGNAVSNNVLYNPWLGAPWTGGDTTPPTVTALTVSDTLISDPDAGKYFWVNITYSEAMNTTINPTITFTPDVKTSGTLTSETFNWADNTHCNVRYIVADVNEVQTGVDVGVSGAKDSAGNTQTSYSAADKFNVDTIAPNITSITPANGAIGVALNQNIIIIFSEKMNTTSIIYTCYSDPGGWASTWNAANDTLTLAHTNFNSSTTYTFNVTAGKDVAGNNLVLGLVPNPWTFITTSTASTIDYIRITDSLGGTEVPNRTVSVGYTITGYASAYNYTSGYIGTVSVTWSVSNASGASASTNPLSGVSSTFNAGLTGGTATWTANYGGKTDTVVFTIIAPTVDYITIVDTGGAGSSAIPNKTVNVGFSITGWAASYNTTAGYLGDGNASWSVSNAGGATAYTSPATGTSSTFNANLTGGTATWTANYGGKTDTVVFTITASAVDYIQIRTAPGGAGTIVGNMTYYIGENNTYWCAGYNYTIGYIGDISVNWWCNNTGVGTVTSSGISTTFTAVGEGICYVEASYFPMKLMVGITNTTGTLLVLAANQPDLTLTSSDISFSNNNPNVNETITINATIQNNGICWIALAHCNSFNSYNGEWVEYDFYQSQSKTVDIIVRATDLDWGTNVPVYVWLDDSQVGNFDITSSSWDLYTVSSVPVSQGNHILRVNMAYGEIPRDLYMDWVRVGNLTIEAETYDRTGGNDPNPNYRGVDGIYPGDVTVKVYDGDPGSGGVLIAEQIVGDLNYVNGGDTPEMKPVLYIKNNGEALLSINWTPTTAGTHTIYVVADPDNLITESDETNNVAWKNITVQSVANQPPIINITYPTVGQVVNGTVTVTGTASDPDAIKKTYVPNGTTVQFVEIKIDNGNWQLAIGTTSWSFALDTTIVSNGWHTIYARAYDGINYSEIKSVNVNVSNPTPDNTPPVISNVQAIPSIQAQGGYVNITCTVTDNVGVNYVYVNITYSDVLIRVPMINIAGTNTYYWNAPYTTTGVYSYVIWANDTSNNVNISAVYMFEIYIPNQPPTAFIDSITPNPAIFGQSVTFTGHGDDPDGSIVAYNWRSSIDGQLSTSASFSTSIMSVGTHTIYFKVQDNDGAWSDEKTEILVINPANQPPTANFTFSPLAPIDLDTIQFTDTSTDSDGTITNWSWNFGDGGISYLQNPTHKYPTYATYQISLTVRDNYGATDTIIKNITILNVPPAANFTHYQGIDVANNDYVNISIRVAGEKHRFVNLTVYENNITSVAFLSVERLPGKPQENSTLLLINSTKLYTIVIDYTAEQKGGNPVWVNITYRNISYSMHLVFHETNTTQLEPALSTTLDFMIRTVGLVKFDASASYDPDGTIVEYLWNFGDGDTNSGTIVYHRYEYGNYTINLTVRDNSNAMASKIRTKNVNDVTGLYAGLTKDKIVTTFCPADMLITNKYNTTQWIGQENGHLVNLMPNAAGIVYGDIEIYLIPLTSDYTYKVSGTDTGTYTFKVYEPGDFEPGDFEPGDFEPGDFNGTVHTLTAPTTSTAEDIIEISADGNQLIIKSNEEKDYTIVINKAQQEFIMSNVTITAGATQTYNVNDWEALETSSNAVTLAVDINSDGIPELNTTTGSGVSGQELWMHKTTEIAGKTIAVSYQGIYIVNITAASQPPTIPEARRSLGLFIKVTSTGNISNLTITISYKDSDLPADADESTLRMYYWDETLSQWISIEDSGVWLNNNTVWAKPTHLTVFAPMAEKSKVPESLHPWVVYGGIVTTIFLILTAVIVVMSRRERRAKKE